MLLHNAHKLAEYARFSSRLASEHAVLTICKHLPAPSLVDTVHGHIQSSVCSWIKTEFRSLLTDWSQEKESAVPFEHPSEAPIWVCWLQGKNQMPSGLQKLVGNMHRLRGEHPLQVIDYECLKTLNLLPGDVLDKYEAGSISPAFLSDIVRICLLERYGGLWMDATILQTRPIPDHVFDTPFWSVKNLDGSFPYSKRIPFALQWQSYFIASSPHSLFTRALESCLLEYVHRYSSMIDYYLVFYFAHLLLTEVPVLRQEYDNLPDNNQLCELLDPFLRHDKSVNHLALPSFRNSGTYLYKLSRHHPYPPGTASTIQALIRPDTDYCR